MPSSSFGHHAPRRSDEPWNVGDSLSLVLRRLWSLGPTVATWLGHQDGGALAMKVYEHLRNEPSLAAANKVTFAA